MQYPEKDPVTGTYIINKNYREIFRLKGLLDEEGIRYFMEKLYDGWGIYIYKGNKVVVDAIEHFYAQGAKSDLIEIWIRKNKSPEGFLDAESAFEKMSCCWRSK